MLEHVTQMLQTVEMDIIKVQKHISNLIHQFTNHRDSCDDTFKTIYSEIQELSVELDIEVSRPRLCKKQTKRSNYTVESTEDYYRVSIYIPYLDSIINSLNVRFSSSTEIPFLLNDLSPKRIIVMSRTEYKSNIDKLNAMYCIDNFVIEALTMTMTMTMK